MADLAQHTNYTGEYSGLLDNLWLTLAIAGVCVLGYELEVHMPRRRGKDGTFRRVPVRAVVALKEQWMSWRARGRSRAASDAIQIVVEKQDTTPPTKEEFDRARLGSREAWEFGYIFQPKAWAVNPAPPVPIWPLAWIGSSLAVRERDMPDKCGLDHTLHARFLRACFFYTLLQACVVLPILLPLHVLYSPDSVAKSSMVKAGISSLVESSGSKWLWVHAVLIWWVTLTWLATTLWIAFGGLGYRRRQIRQLRGRIERERLTVMRQQETGSAQQVTPAVEEPVGLKRFRTIMVTNIPPDMRNGDHLRDYFEHYLHRYRLHFGQATLLSKIDRSTAKTREKAGKIIRKGAFFRKSRGGKEVQGVEAGTSQETVVDDDLSSDEGDSQPAGEVNEVIFVRKLGALASLRQRRMAVVRQLEVAHVKLANRVLSAVLRHKLSHNYQPKLTRVLPEDIVVPEKMTKTQRLDLLTDALGDFVGDTPSQKGQSDDTVWDVLHALPRELLDPYQALTHLTSFMRKENAPLIDFLTTKLNYLTILLEEAKSKSIDCYAPSSTAFVTFKDAETARAALAYLESHPKRTLACHTTPAPDWTDLLWPRVSKSAYRSNYVRSWVVFLGVWAFTIVWIFPVSFFCALTSLTNIAGFIKPLKDWLDANPKASSAITSLAPVILVALLTLCICPILLLISNRAETVLTRYGIHQAVMERFWKFLMVNGVVFFAIGQSAIEAYLTAFQTHDFDPLPIVASAFPTAAPYFASYILLQVAIQPFFEIFRFGLPTIVYVFGTRRSKIPRQRGSRTEYPTFSHFSQVPQQLLGGAIMHLFMLLNPLVIPFALVYYGACYVVWKRQFTYVYGRLYETGGRRTAIRAMRYSIDALALGQFALFAFFILNKAKGHAIATGVLFFLTLIAKLVFTRAIRRRFDALDVEEADLLCPPVPYTGADEEADQQLAAPNEAVTPDPHIIDQHLGLMPSLNRWAEKWKYAANSIHSQTPAGYRRPIPFDDALFGALDRRFTFPDHEEQAVTGEKAERPITDHDEPKAGAETTDVNLVTVHRPLSAWEDIPPYTRSRGYDDQPAYSDDYDDYLWLPRDPLSTLDLDDTIELRLSLTSSAGGNGKFGKWPPEETRVTDTLGSVPMVVSDTPDPRQSPTETLGARTFVSLTPSVSNDQQNLIDHLDIPAEIGSEVDDEGITKDLSRQTARRVGRIAMLLRTPSRSNQLDQPIPLERLSEEGTPAPTTPAMVAAGLPGDAIEQLVDDDPLAERRPGTRREESGTSSIILPATHTATPQRMSWTRQESHPSITITVPPHDETGMTHQHEMEGSGSRAGSVGPSSASILGRSPSGRRPSRLRRDSHGGSQTPMRSGSVMSHDRFASIRSGSSSAAQQALLREVMEEERRVSQSLEEQAEIERQKEHAELQKEQQQQQRQSQQQQQQQGSRQSQASPSPAGGGELPLPVITPRRTSVSS